MTTAALDEYVGRFSGTVGQLLVTGRCFEPASGVFFIPDVATGATQPSRRSDSANDIHRILEASAAAFETTARRTTTTDRAQNVWKGP